VYGDAASKLREIGTCIKLKGWDTQSVVLAACHFCFALKSSGTALMLQKTWSSLEASNKAGHADATTNEQQCWQCEQLAVAAAHGNMMQQNPCIACKHVFLALHMMAQSSQKP
jgi:hypothetical protein